MLGNRGAKNDGVMPRKITETDPLGKFLNFEYDANNNLVKTTDAKGQVTTYTWGYGHQMLTRTDNDGQVTRYQRNALGQTTTAQTPDVTYSYAYDDAHRIKNIADGRGGKELNYFWSPGGLLNATVDSDGNADINQYDPVGRLNGIWAPNGDYVSYAYDAGGRRTEKWLPNGVNTQYAWNPDNTLAQVKNRTGYSDTALVSRHDYSYDGVGQRITSSNTVGAYRIPALNEAYAYDPLGNRTARNDGVTPLYYGYDAANQLTEIHQTSASGPLLAAMIYDANGSLVKKCEGGTVTTNGTDTCNGATVTTLTYNALNQLTQVAKTGQATQTYAYDDQNRRIKKSVGGATTNYLYNGADIHGEYTSWSNANAIYTHGPNTDEPLIRIAANDTRYYHQDGIGSVVATTDANGYLNAAQLYDAWGNPYQTAQLNSIAQYGYTGREPDGTGLVYYRARYYDPAVGRFAQRDPIGLRGGLNRYGYVGNSPVNFTDPSGKCYGPLIELCVAAAETLADTAAGTAIRSGLSAAGTAIRSGLSAAGTAIRGAASTVVDWVESEIGSATVTSSALGGAGAVASTYATNPNPSAKDVLVNGGLGAVGGAATILIPGSGTIKQGAIISGAVDTAIQVVGVWSDPNKSFNPWEAGGALLSGGVASGLTKNFNPSSLAESLSAFTVTWPITTSGTVLGQKLGEDSCGDICVNPQTMGGVSPRY
ncbi:MAG: RHS repeat-associated core domain-containing protein [Nitrosomonadales bacterium]|nr:RHS repeat-associated core domain-containing protein [Nitrosomonadales bacterium]